MGDCVPWEVTAPAGEAYFRGKGDIASSVMQEASVPSLGREYPLKTEMETHFSILAWEIQWTEEPGGLQSMGSQESDMT